MHGRQDILARQVKEGKQNRQDRHGAQAGFLVPQFMFGRRKQDKYAGQAGHAAGKGKEISAILGQAGRQDRTGRHDRQAGHEL